MIPSFLSILYSPNATLHKEKNNASFPGAMLNYGLTGMNLGVVGLLFLSVTLAQFQDAPTITRGIIQTIQYIFGPGLEVFVLIPLLAGIIGIMVGFAFSGVVWIVARGLGGYGTWRDNMYLISFLFLPIAIGSYLVNLIAINPILAAAASTVWGLYTLYIAICAVGVANAITFPRAVLALLSPLIIGVLLRFLLP